MRTRAHPKKALSTRKAASTGFFLSAPVLLLSTLAEDMDSICKHMLQQKQGMIQEHPGTGIAHYLPDFVPHLRLIAVNLTGRAKGLGLHKGAAPASRLGVIKKLLAVRAKPLSPPVLLMAIDRDHLSDDLFLPISFFGDFLTLISAHFPLFRFHAKGPRIISLCGSRIAESGH